MSTLSFLRKAESHVQAFFERGSAHSELQSEELKLVPLQELVSETEEEVLPETEEEVLHVAPKKERDVHVHVLVQVFDWST